jgi:hypothetical protein
VDLKLFEGSGSDKFYPSICMEELRKTAKKFSKDIRFPGRDLNRGLPEYEAGVLSTRL